MDFPKNGKKLAKNGVRQDEQLLINYSGEEHPSESDSDRVKPLELPPTRLRRPKSRKIRVSSSNAKSVFTFWNFCQVLFVVVVIGTMVCMVWFTVVLKTSLDNMKKRVSILETSDRSTSKECAERGNDLIKKVAALQKTTGGVVLSDENHFKSLLHKISLLNKTVGYLKQKLRSPKSVSSIHNDISLLKKAMADTGREMTEVTDKVTQLRKIAHLQNSNVKELRIQLYNVSVQIAKLSGQPTPRPVVNTATPPWLLRVSSDNGSQSKKSKFSSMQAEQLKKNITSTVKKDMNKIVAYVKKANKSVQSKIRSVQLKLSALNKNVSKQKALLDRLIKRTTNENTKNSSAKQDISTVNYEMMHHINNVSTKLDILTSQFDEHDKRFEEMVLDVSSMNSTVFQHMIKQKHPAVASCNCSMDSVWKAIESLQTTLNSVKNSLELKNKETQTASALLKTTAILPKDKKTLTITTTNSAVRETTQKSSKHTEKGQTSSEPTTAPRTTSTSTKSSQSKSTTTTARTTTTENPLKDDADTKRDNEEDVDENDDLNSYPETDADGDILPKDNEH